MKADAWFMVSLTGSLDSETDRVEEELLEYFGERFKENCSMDGIKINSVKVEAIGVKEVVKKPIKVTVVYPVTFQAEIDTSKELCEQREQIKRQADVVFDATAMDSIVHQCDEIPELVE